MTEIPEDLPSQLEPHERTLPAVTSSAGGSESGSDREAGSGFTTGSILAGRYRLVTRLGSGGMGEVYRADDLKLRETVALKLLPAHFTLDEEALERFHREARMSRQVAHRHVCRVFDIGEAEGVPFLTMEYIDGEDLSSLLRRIGRLPEVKAVELAHQLCAGLAAAHEAGVLHRDLKPANVMIDGKGRAKITDFGLAHLVDELQDRNEVAGTPAYMAPEQLRGEAAGVATDLYALGLVLYEMFTGEKAFEEENWMSLISRGGRTEAPVPPSEHVETLDPAIDRALTSALDTDPAMRPGSALELAALLPGGDPLAAALAAGETPSPEMVASVPDRGLLDERLAVGAVVLVLLLLGVTHLAGRGTLLAKVDPTKAPEVQQDRAQEVLRDIGFEGPSTDRVGAYHFEEERLERAALRLRTPSEWSRRAGERPMLVTYWYRQAPGSLMPWQVAWDPKPFDPPPIAGEAFVVLDAHGRLERLRLEPLPGPRSPGGPAAGGPAAGDPAAGAPASLDLAEQELELRRILFRAAELAPERFKEVEGACRGESGIPPHDRHRAWVGQGDAGEPLRVDLAMLGGAPVLFAVGDEEPHLDPPTVGTPIPKGQEILLITYFVLMGAALFLAARHLRRGRADRRGARALGLFVAALTFVGLTAGAGHMFSSGGFLLRLEILEATAFRGVAVMFMYLALEPLIRRRAPEVLVSSTRLLGGRWRDPRVGRDVLAGLVVGAGTVALCAVVNLWMPVFGERPIQVYGLEQKLSGFGGTLYWMTFSLFLQLTGCLLLCLLYALLVALWKRRAAAGLGLWVVGVAIGGFSPLAMLGALLFVLTLVRFGILATMVAWTCIDWVLFFPTGAGLGDWWLTAAVLPSLGLVLLAIYSARTATGRVHGRRSRGADSRLGGSSLANASWRRGSRSF